MHQLVKAVLTICSWFTYDNGTSLDSRVKSSAIFRASFSITFHIELLNVSWEPQKSLTIREDCTRLDPTDVCVIEAYKAKHGSWARSQIAVQR